MTRFNCEACNANHDGSHGSGRFCSVTCSNSRDHKGNVNKSCVHCDVDVLVVTTYPTKYVMCDNCKPSNRRKPRKKQSGNCPVCGLEVKCRVSTYCSRDCSTVAMRNKRYEFIKNTNGLGDKGYRPSIRVLKNFVITSRGHRCSICGIKKWNDNPAPLVIDHINGRSSDNRLDNLRLVCGNCDMQLDTYKSKNKNSDRAVRRNRYHKTK